MEGMNNYKGVMLCSRPNEPAANILGKPKPFCSRVDNKAQLGLNPVKNPEQEVERPKRVNMVLQRHKDWLEVFKLKMKYKREMQDDARQEEKDKFEKIKEQAAKNRERTKKMKQDFDALNQKIMDELDDNSSQPKKTYKLTSNNLKKLDEINKAVDNDSIQDQNNNNSYGDDGNYEELMKQYQDEDNDEELQQKHTQKSILKNSNKKNNNKKKTNKKKPEWAYTEQEMKDKEELDELGDADELLNFVDNLDYDKYVNDLEVQTMLKSIRNRVDELKQDVNWREKARQRIQQRREEIRQEKMQQQDNASEFSQDGAKSVASERTQQSIQSLREQLNDEKQGKNIVWDASTQGERQTIEEKIAKLVADEVIRNYKHLGNVHSNKSIRQMLVKEAGKHLQPTALEVAQRYDGPNIQVVKERTLRKDQLDPNTLPYMHRNPAI